MPTKKSFRVKLESCTGSQAARFTIPFDAEKVFGTRARVPVRGTLNGHPFRSSIFPTGEGSHYMVVNRETREGAKVKAGDTVSFVMERDEETRVIVAPPELARALSANKNAKAAWDKLSYTRQKEHARAVEEARRPETRARRVEKVIAELSAGRKSSR
ncbi:MAG TPA: YdeI/OmpD-associated family protein [Pyrinomonadaceae bacterium]